MLLYLYPTTLHIFDAFSFKFQALSEIEISARRSHRILKKKKRNDKFTLLQKFLKPCIILSFWNSFFQCIFWKSPVWCQELWICNIVLIVPVLSQGQSLLSLCFSWSSCDLIFYLKHWRTFWTHWIDCS